MKATRLMTPTEVAAELKCHVDTLMRMSSTGRFPPPVRPAGAKGRPAWLPSEVTKFIEQLVRERAASAARGGRKT